MKFAATAEHSGGGSVSHPCRTGVYHDPTDMWQVEIEAESEKEATSAALRMLRAEVEEYQPCTCRLAHQPGSESWWNSVSIALWPRDAAAMASWIESGGDPSYDPYGLIPGDLVGARRS